MNTSLQETLLKVGMEPTVIEIYLILIENGEMTVPQILEKTQLSRATVYEALPVLLAQGFLEYRKVGRVAYYKPTHPSKLFSLLEERKREVALLEGEMGETIKSITGLYNLASSKPGVRFFEGMEGLREALFHSLSATETIYTFVNSDTAADYAKALDEEYIAERVKRGIKKQLIMPDTPSAREYIKNMNTNLTEAKLLDPQKYPFQVATEVYDNTVSYLTAGKEHTVAVLIEHPAIAEYQKSVFRYFWDTLPSIS